MAMMMSIYYVCEEKKKKNNNMVNIWNMVRRQRINQYKTRRSTHNNDNKSFFFVGFCSLLQVSYIYIFVVRCDCSRSLSIFRMM